MVSISSHVPNGTRQSQILLSEVLNKLIVDLLIDHVANVNARYSETIATAIRYAYQEGGQSMAEHLLEKGASIAEVDVDGRMVLEWDMDYVPSDNR